MEKSIQIDRLERRAWLLKMAAEEDKQDIYIGPVCTQDACPCGQVCKPNQPHNEVVL